MKRITAFAAELATTLLCLALFALCSGCTSVIKVAPYPTPAPWSDDVKRLGTVTADSGRWPLSLHSVPPDYTFYAALRAKASSQFNVPEAEVLLGEVTVKIGAELDGTIRDWKATAIAGRGIAGQGKESQPAISGRASESAPARSPADALMEIKRLLDSGAITKDEYEALKKPLLEKLGNAGGAQAPSHGAELPSAEPAQTCWVGAQQMSGDACK